MKTTLIAAILALAAAPEARALQGWSLVTDVPPGINGNGDPSGNPGFQSGGAAVIDGNLIVFGGATSSGSFSRTWSYDLSSDGPWILRAPVTDPALSQFVGMGTVVAGGFIFSIGGFDGGMGVMNDKVYAYDPKADHWAVAANPMPTGRYGHCCACVGGRIYVIGGFAIENWTLIPQSGVDVYDPISGTWTTDDDVPQAFGLGYGGAIGNKIYVAGGYTGNDYSGATTKAFVFDPSLPSGQRWTELPPLDSASGDATLSTGLVEGASAVFGDSLYCIGGYGGTTSTYQDGAYVGAVAYSPATGLWTRATDLIYPAASAVAAVGPDAIYIVGGSHCDRVQVSSSLPGYSPAMVPLLPSQLKQRDGAQTLVQPGDDLSGKPAVLEALAVAATGHKVGLEVQVVKAGQPFPATGSIYSSPLVAAGTIQVRVPLSELEVGYIWRARTVDPDGATSDWVAAGGNPAFILVDGTDYDYVAPPPPPVDGSASKKTCIASTGSGSAALASLLAILAGMALRRSP